MSGRLVSYVLDSALPAWLKPYATAFASFANDDGSSVFPTLTRVATMVGRSRRSARRATRDLRRLGVLVPIAPPGHYHAIEYRFNAARLPLRGDLVQLGFPQFPQVLTGHPCPPMGDTHVPRSVSDPSFSTHLRAREKGKYPRTGTR